LPASSLFDVERFRSEPARLAVVRQISVPTLVLGSTQPAELISRDRVNARGVEVVRRRGGGGSVYLGPGGFLWIDAWIPRDDPLWHGDVSAAAAWAGAWWVESLISVGLDDLVIHVGRSRPGELGELVCFAGRGPGEVFHQGRKVMGLSQWRSREGSLFSMCAYARWDPRPLLDLLPLDDDVRDALAADLIPAAVGVGDLTDGGASLDALGGHLLASFSGWE
jgi:lipoate---protein ligase